MSIENARRAGVLGGRSGADNVDLANLVDDIAEQRADSIVGSGFRPGDLDVALWNTLHESGLTTLTSTPGLEAGPRELAVVLYGLARRAADVPIAETDLMAAWLAAQANRQLPEGAVTIAIADGAHDTQRITGIAEYVPWTHQASAIVLAVRSVDALWMSVVTANELDIEVGHNLSGESRDRVRFDLDLHEFTALDAASADELILRGAWARCIQTVGALDRAADLTIEHARNRIQFGKPLSGLQSVQHALALMAGEIECTRAAVALTVAAAADYGFAAEPTRFAIYVAKVVVGQAVNVVNTIAHQLHGALGVTFEHRLWQSTMRAQGWVDEFGGPEHYARELGELILDAQSPWAIMIDGHDLPAFVMSKT